jgi:hypothetical protein
VAAASRSTTGHEHPGDPVGEPLHRCLAALRVRDQLRHLGQGRLAADPRRRDDEATAHVGGGADHRVAGTDLDGHALTGEQGLVHGGGAGHDLAVGRHPLPRSHHEAHADAQLPDRDAPLGPGIVDHGHVLGAEVEERLQRGAGAPLGPRLEVPAGEDEGGDGGRHLQVDLVGSAPALEPDRHRHRHARLPRLTEEEGVERPGEGGEDPDGDEGVHRRRTVPEVRPGGPVERPRRPGGDRGGQGERQPLPALELERGDHGEEQDGHGEGGGADQAVAQRHQVEVVADRRRRPGRPRRSGERGRVPGRLDRGDQLVGGHRDRVVVDPRLLRRVVHAGGDAVELVQLLLDAHGARGAGHARDRQLDALGGGGGRHRLRDLRDRRRHPPVPLS